jgi:hypothetical protein
MHSIKGKNKPEKAQKQEVNKGIEERCDSRSEWYQTKLLKSPRDSIQEPLLTIFRKSLEKGKAPLEWKTMTAGFKIQKGQ